MVSPWLAFEGYWGGLLSFFEWILVTEHDFWRIIQTNRNGKLKKEGRKWKESSREHVSRCKYPGEKAKLSILSLCFLSSLSAAYLKSFFVPSPAKKENGMVHQFKRLDSCLQTVTFDL